MTSITKLMPETDAEYAAEAKQALIAYAEEIPYTSLTNRRVPKEILKEIALWNITKKPLSESIKKMQNSIIAQAKTIRRKELMPSLFNEENVKTRNHNSMSHAEAIQLYETIKSNQDVIRNNFKKDAYEYFKKLVPFEMTIQNFHSIVTNNFVDLNYKEKPKKTSAKQSTNKEIYLKIISYLHTKYMDVPEDLLNLLK